MTTCAQAQAPGPPIRELMTGLAPHAKTSVALLLNAFCPNGTFDDAGLYEVRVKLDASRMTGEGDPRPTLAEADTAAYVRVRRGQSVDVRPRPKLQEP